MKLEKQSKERNSPPSRSPNKIPPRQYRLEITKIAEGMPEGAYLAYCIVSKESSMGLFVHQRLLVLDTANKELRYYSELPQLPIQHVQALGKPKETVNYITAKRFEFALERIRIGHVNVRWIERNETKNWKLIMGSNKLAEDFSRLILEDSGINQSIVKSSLDDHLRQPVLKQNVARKQELSPEQLNRQQKQNQFQLTNLQQKQIRQLAISPTANVASPHFIGQKSAAQVGEDIKTVQRETLDYFSRNYINISIQRSNEQQQQTRPVSYHTYHAYNPLTIPDYSEHKQPPEIKASLVSEWLDTTDGRSRAIVYKKFMDVCQKKIQLFMEDFYKTHLQHEQEDGMCILYDREIRYIYCPLLDSLEEESAEQLVQKVRDEERCFQEWRSVDYLSGFDRIDAVRVLVPLCCIISYKGMRFYCKAMIDYYPSKQLLSEADTINERVSQLQQKTHVKLRNHMSRIYILQNKYGTIIYLDKVNCLPHLEINRPLPYQYIQNYISRGVISSEKDLSVIRNHINNELIAQAIEVINRKQLSSAFQVAQTLKELGMSHHYLHLLENKAKTGYFKRLVLSEIVAYAVQWEIRRKMQLELFKRKDLGFAINQVKKSLNALFQSQQRYLRLISNIIEVFYQHKYDFEAYPIDTYIVGEAVLSQVLYRLGLDCKVLVNDSELKGWIWLSKNIEDKMQLSVFSVFQTLRWTCFSSFPQNIIQKQLFEEMNYQLRKQTPLTSAFEIIKVQKDSAGLIIASPEYLMLRAKQRIEIDYYLSHFIVPRLDGKPQNCLQSLIYSNFNRLQYSMHSLEFLTVLNQVRWLIKERHHHQAQRILPTITRRAILWNQAYAIIQIYSFYSQYKLKQGDISSALEFSSKAVQVALAHYEQQQTLLMQLLIAEQAFETANIYFVIQDFSKALQLYSKASSLLKRLTFSRKSVSLNPEFILLYYRKCSIYLMFGQYQNCLNECLQGLQCSQKITSPELRMAVDQKQQMLYEVLFRCYDIQNKRKEMIEVAEICSHKYFQDRIIATEEIDELVLGEVIKMVWLGIIKQIQINSPLTNIASRDLQQIRYIQLINVRKELQTLRRKLKAQLRYSKKEASNYMAQRILKKKEERVENRLKGQIILCMVEASSKHLQMWEGSIFSAAALASEAVLMEVLAILTSFDFLVGTMQASLHLYSFQY